MYEICKDNNCSDNNLSKIAIVRQIFFIGSLFLGAVVPLITITIVNMMTVKVIVQRKYTNSEDVLLIYVSVSVSDF